MSGSGQGGVPILMVAPYFAPQSHAAMFRSYKLAKYLPRYGFRPFVLTTDTNYTYPEDPALLPALPPETTVVPVRYVEPSARGLRMALGGGDRSFATVGAPAPAPPAPAGGGKASGPSVAQRVYRYALDRYLRVPDRYWTWRRPALAAARELIRAHDIKLVYTSADPYTCHLIGHALQQDGLKWVADLRDPHTYSFRTGSKHAAVFAKQRAAERTAAVEADAVATASEGIAMILTDSYGLAEDRSLHTIPTGLDEELLPDRDAPAPRPFPYLLFSGEFLPSYGTGLFASFAAALADPELRAQRWKLLFVGRREVNEPTVRRLMAPYDLEDHVELVDHVPQQELYRLLVGARGAILAMAPRFRWWCLHAKLIDYLALRVPVVAIVPDPSEARMRLQRAGLGVFLDGAPAARTETLRGFMRGEVSPPGPFAEGCDYFLAQRQIRDFAGLFQGLLAAPGSSS